MDGQRLHGLLLGLDVTLRGLRVRWMSARFGAGQVAGLSALALAVGVWLGLMLGAKERPLARRAPPGEPTVVFKKSAPAATGGNGQRLVLSDVPMAEGVLRTLQPRYGNSPVSQALARQVAVQLAVRGSELEARATSTESFSALANTSGEALEAIARVLSGLPPSRSQERGELLRLAAGLPIDESRKEARALQSLLTSQLGRSSGR